MKRVTSIILLVLVWLPNFRSWSQNFGQNKPHYTKFEFSVFQSPHFEFYTYMENEEYKKELAQYAEQWYKHHQTIFKDSFDRKNPIILYNNHPDFQQTVAISGTIGEGTGGVTESLKNRVVFPILFSNKQTNHVLGHELVHAFQYHLIFSHNERERERVETLKAMPRKRGKKKTATDTVLVQPQDTVANLIDFRNLPLWMIEGMAEYLSVGRTDPQTSMWLRDAVKHNRLPSIKDLYNMAEYFPYRWGQAFWAYVVGTYGEEAMLPLFIETGQYGIDRALIRNTGMDSRAFSTQWKKSLRSYYSGVDSLFNVTPDLATGLTIDDEARINVGPEISPDGRYYVFVSERDLFALDLFLADVQTGKVVKKLTTTSRLGHLDAIASIETSATWSPDSRRIAYVGFQKGKNVLVVQDVFSGKVSNYELDGVPAFRTPSWSPIGDYIVVSGLVDGYVDLFLIELQSGQTKRLTKDRYSELMPSWSTDGEKLIYSTDRYTLDRISEHGDLYYQIEVLDLNTYEINRPSINVGGNQMNPRFDPDGQGIWLLSDHDGFRDLYYYHVENEVLERKTKLWTGITGITPYAPAFSVSGRGDLIYSIYMHNQFEIYRHDKEDLKLIDHRISVNYNDLPPSVQDKVTTSVAAIIPNSTDTAFTLKHVPYKPKFKLDFISGQAGVGVATSSLGTASGINGGVNMFFSDILGYQQFFTAVSLNGEIQDFAMQTAFVNQKGRLPWGVSVSHIPYRSGIMRYGGVEPFYIGNDTLLAHHYMFDLYRTFEEQLAASVYYPLNVHKRFEFSGSVAYYHRSLTRYHTYYFGPVPLASGRERIKDSNDMFLESLSVAFVHDNSNFAITAPVSGSRYRLEAGQVFGALNFNSLMADYRKYVFVKPVTFATRLMHYGRYGNSNQLQPLYIGYPGLVRGYSLNRLVNSFQYDYSFMLDQMVGTKISMMSMELRVPFTGPKQLSLIPSKFLFSDLALFVDSGVAYHHYSSLFDDTTTDLGTNTYRSDPLLVTSVGLSYRINIGGLIIEPFYAVPLQDGFRPGMGFNILPGW